MALIFPLRGSLVQLTTYLLGTILGIILASRQWRLLRTPELTRDQARRGRLAATAILLGIAPMVVAVGLQSASLLLLRRQVLPAWVMTVSFLMMVFVPAGLGYAILGRRVDTFGLLVRRAALFAVASRTIRLASLVPAAVLGFTLFEHRDETIASIFRSHPVAASLALATAVIGLRYGERFHTMLERLFSRERVTSRLILQALAEKTRGVTDASALSELVCAEIDRAFHLESITLLLADSRAEVFASRDGSVAVAGTSGLVSAVDDADNLLDLDGSGVFDRISEEEVHWLRERRVQLLVPMRGGEGGLLGFLALGEKQSELPFDAEDREMLLVVATAASLAIENHILRSSPSAPRFTPPDPDAADLARHCLACRAVFPSDTVLCPFDGTSLMLTDVPAVVNSKYRIEERLGAGGMGVVYRARDLALGRTVALKTLPSLSAHAAARLRREARTVALLAHDHLAVIHASETWRGRPILVFEYLAGGTLDRRIRIAPLGATDLLALSAAIASALASAHAAGILHRDVKPSNIGFDAMGRPKLLDFGLAQFTDEMSQGREHDASATAGGESSSSLVGTHAYLSPEMVLGAAPSTAGDLWALALTSYEALTGVNPFRDANPTRTMNRIVANEVPDPRQLRPDCPAPLADLLSRALDKDPSVRPQSANDLHAAFERLRVSSGATTA